MLKKILSFVLCFTMLFAVMPLGASAAGAALSAVETPVSGSVYKLTFAPSVSGGYSAVEVTLSYDNAVIVPVSHKDFSVVSVTNGSKTTLPFDTPLTEVDYDDDEVDAKKIADWTVSGGTTSIAFSVAAEYGTTFTSSTAFEFYYKIADGKQNAIPEDAFVVNSARIVSGGSPYSVNCQPTFRKSLMGRIMVASSYKVGDTIAPTYSLSPSSANVSYKLYIGGVETAMTNQRYTISRADAGKTVKVTATASETYVSGTVESDVITIAPLTSIPSIDIVIPRPEAEANVQTTFVAEGYTYTVNWDAAKYSIGGTPKITSITFTPGLTYAFADAVSVTVNGTLRVRTRSGDNIVVSDAITYDKITSEIAAVALDTAASSPLIPTGANYTAVCTSTTSEIGKLVKKEYKVTPNNGYLFPNNVTAVVSPADSTISKCEKNPDGTVTVTVEFKPNEVTTATVTGSAAVGDKLIVSGDYDLYKWYAVKGSSKIYLVQNTTGELEIINEHIGSKICVECFITSTVDSTVDVEVAEYTTPTEVPQLELTSVTASVSGTYKYGERLGSKTPTATALYNGISIAGKIEFNNSNIIPTTGTYQATFTPTSGHYKTKTDVQISVTVESITPTLDFDFDSSALTIGSASVIRVIPNVSYPYSSIPLNSSNIRITVEKNGAAYPLNPDGFSFTTAADDVDGVTKYKVTLYHDAVEGKFNTTAMVKEFTVEEDPNLAAKVAVNEAFEKISAAVLPNNVSYLDAETKEAAVYYAKEAIKEIIDDTAITVELVDSVFVASEKGSADDNDGTPGSLTYKIKLTATLEGGTYPKTSTTAYTMSIVAEKYNKSTVNTLKTLKYSIGSLQYIDVGIVSGKTSYNVALNSNFDGYSVKFRAEATDENARVEIGSCTISGGYALGKIVVTAESGAKLTYSVTFSSNGTSYTPNYSTPGTGTTYYPTTTYPTTTYPTTTTPATTDTTTPTTDASTMANTSTGLSYSDGIVRYKTADRELIPYYIDSNGREVEVTIADYDEDNGELVFVGNDTTEYFFRRGSRVYFNDISSHWSRSYVEAVSRLNLFIGTSSGKFSPDLKMTYGMLVTVLGRMSGDSIASDSGYGPYTRWADAKGITKSLPPLTENDQISRQDAAVLLMNFANYMGIDESRTSVARFIDGHTISSYAVPSVATLSYHSVIIGRDTGNFDPFATLTRAETAVLILNVIPFILKID